MTDRPRYSRDDLDTLTGKSRAEILDILGSFDERGPDDDAFVLLAARLLDPARVAGLAEAIESDDASAVGEAVLAACTRDKAQGPLPSGVAVHAKTTVADDILENRFTFYGETHQLPDDFDWDANPGTAHWGHDLNRFSYLPALSQAQVETGDSRYGRKAVDLILDWIAKCEIERCFAGTPYVFGSYLNNTIHCSVWARCVEKLLPTGIIAPIELLRIVKSLHEQIGYLEVVTNGHAGNWPTIGCQGVLATIAALPVFRDQDRFTQYFIETLDVQVAAQVLPDGVQDELTPHYHAVVVNNILTCAESCAALGLSLEPRTLDTLRKMVRYQAQTVVPDGSAQVAFNDSDPEAVPAVADRLRAIGMADYLPDPNSLGPEAYPYAGVAFLRQRPSEGDLYLAFDGGPFGRSHQHEDKLGFWLHAFGRNLIVDPGRHLYDKSEVSFYPYLTSTHAHSTITVDGHGQNSRAHRDTWIADAPGSLTYAEEKGRIRASARYDLGYGAVNAIDVVHHREIVFVDGHFWVLFDTITGEGEHQVESRFQFAPGDLSVDGASAVTQNDDANLQLTATGTWDTVRVLKGETDPRAGWYSASYNRIEPAPALSLVRKQALPVRYAVLLLPYRGTTPPASTIVLEGDSAVVTVDGESTDVTSPAP